MKYGMVRISVTAAAAALLAVAVGPAPASAAREKDQGCSAEFWRTHLSSWEEYRPTSIVSNAWTMKNLPREERKLTFHQALEDPGVRGSASRALLRAAVTSYLNASHEKIYYPYRRFARPYNLRVAVTRAIATGDSQQMRAVARDLNRANNAPCPLSRAAR